MPDQVRVFVNDRGCALSPGALVRDAIATAEPELLSACLSGEALVTDGRGLPIGLDTPVTGGLIVRARRSSRRDPADADA